MTGARRSPRWLDPIGAAIFCGLWVMAEAGRVQPLTESATEASRTWMVLLGYTSAIATARWLPTVSIALITAVPILQLVGVLAPVDPTQAPILLAAFWVAFVAARSGPTPVVLISLGSAVVQAGALGFGVQNAVDTVYSVSDPQGDAGAALSGTAAAVLYLALFTASWSVGFVLRRNAEQRDERRRLADIEADLKAAESELQIVRERGAVAQEVHDVLAHSLAVVVAMADGSRFIREKRPETTDASLQDIADAARSALVDLRGLMQELTEQTGRPQPGLADVDALLERMRAAGLGVSAIQSGEPGGLSPAQELAVFRILQEALTNALEHAGRRTDVTVSLDWRGPGLSMTVRSASSGVSSSASNRTPQGEQARGRGFGVRGMTERARLAGGWLTAESTSEDGAGFLVTAFIPTPARAGRIEA